MNRTTVNQGTEISRVAHLMFTRHKLTSNELCSFMRQALVVKIHSRILLNVAVRAHMAHSEAYAYIKREEKRW